MKQLTTLFIFLFCVIYIIKCNGFARSPVTSRFPALTATIHRSNSNTNIFQTELSYSRSNILVDSKNFLFAFTKSLWLEKKQNIVNFWKKLRKQTTTLILCSIIAISSILTYPVSSHAKDISGGVIGGSSRSSQRTNSANRRSISSKASSSKSKSFTNQGKHSYHYHVDSSSSMMVLTAPSGCFMNGVQSRASSMIQLAFLSYAIFMIIASKLSSMNKLDRISLQSFDSTLQLVQLCFTLTDDEKQEFLRDIQSIVDKHQIQTESNLIDMAFDISVLLMRLCQNESLVGGRMDMTKYSGNKKNRVIINDEFDRLSITEQSKFRTEPKYLPQTTLISTSDSSDELLRKRSNLIVTIILETFGPVLKHKGWTMKKERGLLEMLLSALSFDRQSPRPPSSKDIQEYIIQFPSYLRKIKALEEEIIELNQQREANDELSDGSGLNEIPEFRMKILWVPNKDSDILTDKEVKSKWPELYAI